ncbi:MAG: alpha/beta hydrolase [Pseudomonadota bacterium]
MVGRTPLLAALIVFAITAAAEPVTLTAADGVKVFGDYQAASKPGAPLILAFHQAESSSAEYKPLISRLNQAGFSVLAIDQRSGGDEFGGENKTVASLGRSGSYESALQDMESALAWGKSRANGSPVLVWGSSYSAALVFVLAARHPADIHALLAFSPGEYLAKTEAVRTAAKTVTVPVFIDQASDEGEIAASRSIVAAVATPAAGKVNFIGRKNSVHGSATLRSDSNPAGAEENWQAVLAFLSRFKGAR